jgi:hypothetical protein
LQVSFAEGSPAWLIRLLTGNPKKHIVIVAPYDSSRTSPIEVAAGGKSLVDRIVSSGGVPAVSYPPFPHLTCRWPQVIVFRVTKAPSSWVALVIVVYFASASLCVFEDR